jgi:hypothetical protein
MVSFRLDRRLASKGVEREFELAERRRSVTQRQRCGSRSSRCIKNRDEPNLILSDDGLGELGQPFRVVFLDQDPRPRHQHRKAKRTTSCELER